MLALHSGRGPILVYYSPVQNWKMSLRYLFWVKTRNPGCSFEDIFFALLPPFLRCLGMLQQDDFSLRFRVEWAHTT